MKGGLWPPFVLQEFTGSKDWQKGMVKQIKLILEYDGSRYSGWQVQPNGLSVQEVVENSLEQLLGEKVRLVSSGRTVITSYSIHYTKLYERRIELLNSGGLSWTPCRWKGV